MTRASHGVSRPGIGEPGWDISALAPKLATRTVTWIQGRAGQAKPFFLYVPLVAPHWPLVPSAEWKGTSQAGPYGDFSQQMDEDVGRILDAIDAIGQRDNTLVIFLSDNGGYGKARSFERTKTLLSEFQHRTNGDFKGYKTDIWEGGHRIPMIVRWPGRVPAGSVVSKHVFALDLFRTLARVAGAEIPAGAGPDSFDMMPELVPGSARSGLPRPNAVYHSNTGTFALRQGKWKLVVEEDRPYLYDIEADPYETTDLATKRPGVRTVLLSALNAIAASAATYPSLSP